MISFLNNVNLDNLIMYSSDVYWEMITQYNYAIWPTQIFIIVLNITLFISILRFNTYRAFFIYSGILFLFLSEFYLNQHFTTINWPVSYFSYAFITEGLALIFWSIRKKDLNQTSHPNKVGIILLGLSIIIPAQIFLTDWKLHLTQLFGFGLEATCLGLIGILFGIRGLTTRLLTIVPVIWLLLSLAIYIF